MGGTGGNARADAGVIGSRAVTFDAGKGCKHIPRFSPPENDHG